MTELLNKNIKPQYNLGKKLIYKYDNELSFWEKMNIYTLKINLFAIQISKLEVLI